ncbi:hypothetical protein LCGC14_1746180 [marine sediment metagenome]|uniref:Uncharacterized protein n=1 Tax=marine sediment metagenome TaxID=412755 RepID=A0A0F9H564_9ZZZZ
MNTDTYIFGYTDADGRDEIVLCAKCGADFFKACPKEWAILRTEHAVKYPDGRKCDKCTEQVYFPSISEALAPGRIEKRNILDNDPNPRLVVYAKYLETLEL